MNTVCLVGRLARAPVVRFEHDGVQTCTFPLAVQEPGRQGTPYVLYVLCSAYGRSAEQAGVLSAEDLIAVQGKLGWRKHRAPCGQEHSQVIVQVREMTLLQAAVLVGVTGNPN
jgi:single-stranded DNA-binding protein